MELTENPALSDARQRLVGHPMYSRLATPAAIQTFMEHHVFAVWDFFSLLKRLQREVTCVSLPWLPKQRAEHGRFIMEIVISEESDEDLGGGYTSHFELYRRAMDEVGADTTTIDRFVEQVRAGEDPIGLLGTMSIPEGAEQFVQHSLGLALHGQPHQVAASFCHGRENLLPDVLGALKDGIGDGLDATPVFQHYVERHIELDHDEHGPLALRLLDAMCEGDPIRQAEADAVGVEAIEARILLWDSVLTRLDSTQS